MTKKQRAALVQEELEKLYLKEKNEKKEDNNNKEDVAIYSPNTNLNSRFDFIINKLFIIT